MKREARGWRELRRRRRRRRPSHSPSSLSVTVAVFVAVAAAAAVVVVVVAAAAAVTVVVHLFSFLLFVLLLFASFFSFSFSSASSSSSSSFFFFILCSFVSFFLMAYTRSSLFRLSVPCGESRGPTAWSIRPGALLPRRISRESRTRLRELWASRVCGVRGEENFFGEMTAGDNDVDAPLWFRNARRFPIIAGLL
jgi:hypothetical protein